MTNIIRELQNVPDSVWNWGPGFFTLIVFMLVVRQFLKAYMPEFLVAQREQTRAMVCQAEAIQRVAQGLETAQSTNAHATERILLNIRILHDDVSTLHENVAHVTTLSGEVGRLRDDIAALAQLMEGRTNADRPARCAQPTA